MTPELNTTAALLAALGILLVVSVMFSRALDRFGVPFVLLFLILGILAGSEGIGGIPFADYRLAFRVGSCALILILFDGGFNTPVARLRGSLAPASVLATVGVAFTAGLVALFSRALGLSWPHSLLLGAVVSSTDAAVVFAVLRGANLRLEKRLQTTLELESGLNDPMAVILTIAVTEALIGGSVDPMSLVKGIPLQLGIGVVVGLGVGGLAVALLRRVRLTSGGLYAVLTFGLAFASFGVASLLNGSGFLSVYLTAVVLGNSELPYRGGLQRIHDAAAWLSQISMFLVLGLLVFPSQLVPVAPVGLAVAFALVFLARPVAVSLCLLPFQFRFIEIVYAGWVGLRGAVPIILATFPILADVPEAMKIFNIVFFIVIVNAVIPGATIRYVTRRLGLESPEVPSPVAALEIHSTRLLRGELMSFHVTSALAVCDAALASIPFPPDSAVILIVRGEELLAARGKTVLRDGDHVYVFCRREDKPFIELLFGRPQGSDD